MSDDRSTPDSDGAAFDPAREKFEAVVGRLASGDAAEMTHAELEARLDGDGREILRLLYQSHFDLLALREERLPQVTRDDGEESTHVRAGERRQTTRFGAVRIGRLRLHDKALGIKRRAGLTARPSCAALPALFACSYPHLSTDRSGPVHVGCSARRGGVRSMKVGAHAATASRHAGEPSGVRWTTRCMSSSQRPAFR